MVFMKVLFYISNRQLHNYLQIGGRAYLIGDQYNGYIDDIIIYNRYLDEDEVFELYDKTRELVYGCNHPNALNYDILVDIDDGSCQFETVQIGHQVWMTENLKATHYSNGDAIQTGLDNEAWTSTERGLIQFMMMTLLMLKYMVIYIIGMLHMMIEVYALRLACPFR